MWYAVLIAALCCLLVYKWFKWWIAAAVLSAWLVEKNYAPPTEKDCKRLSQWVMHNVGKDLTGRS